MPNHKLCKCAERGELQIKNFDFTLVPLLRAVTTWWYILRNSKGEVKCLQVINEFDPNNRRWNKIFHITTLCSVC